MIAVHCPSSSSYLLTAFWQGAKNVVPKKLTAIMAGLFCAQNKLFLMFVRLKKVKDPKGKIHIYEQLVESYRVHGKIKQKVVMTLGKKGEVSADRIQNIIRILIKKDPTLELVRKFDQKASDIKIRDSKIYGSYVVFRHLWKLLHLEEAMKKIAPMHNKELFEEMVFMLTIARLINPASDRKTLHVFEPAVYHRLGKAPKLNSWYEVINRLQKKAIYH